MNKQRYIVPVSRCIVIDARTLICGSPTSLKLSTQSFSDEASVESKSRDTDSEWTSLDDLF